MTKIPASISITPKIIEEPISKIMIISNARKLLAVHATILIASTPITKLSSCIIQAATKANFAKNILPLGKPLKIQTTKHLSSHCARMAKFVLLLITKVKFQSNLLTNSRKTYNFICTLTKLSGVLSRLITTDLNAFMLTISKTIDGTQKNTTMSILNVPSGKKMRT